MKKLNAKGFSHEVIMIAFVAIVAITGVAYLVASHAQTSSPKASTASARCINYAVREGWRGHCVTDIQAILKKDTHFTYLAVDGIFGPQTKTAVYNYQKDYRLSPASGTVGSKTWHALCGDAGAYREFATGDLNTYAHDAGCPGF